MSTPDFETVRQAFLAHRRKHGLDATLKIIRDVTGDDALEGASDEERARLLIEFGDDAPAGEAPAFITNGTLNASAIYAKWNAPRGGRKGG